VSRHDPRVDIYALGLTLLECLLGRHPFEDLKPDEAIQARVEHAFVSPDLPRWVQEVLLKATHPTPELRYQTARDFAEAIRARHVAYVFDSKRIKADALANLAERALARRKWRSAERLTLHALQVSPESVPALVAAGRCQLLIRRIDQASEYFTRALALNPRVHVQKELGWVSLEQGRVPMAISMLTDHLQRSASDYEAYNLLLKCFYLSGRYEAGKSLARTLMKEKTRNRCFRDNWVLCRLLNGDYDGRTLPKLGDAMGPFLGYNTTVATEEPRSWETEGRLLLKMKLLFEEYRFGSAGREGRANTLLILTPDGVQHEIAKPIVTIGSLRANDVVLDDASVSRRHCLIVNYFQDVWLYDLDSTVGTMVDGRSLKGRMFVEGVCEVSVGRVRLRVSGSSDMLV
jgi:tetratricopeptide (TPR) repeat protein